MRESEGVRPRALVLALLPWASLGCLVEYVLPGETSAGDPSTAAASEETTPTGETGASEAGSDETGCAGTVCAGACVDVSQDDAHCGRCGDPCDADERCIAGECRDVVVVECASCPCPDQCPEGAGVIESTTSGGDGDPQKYLCCADVEGLATALCVVGDLDETLVCPARQ